MNRVLVFLYIRPLLMIAVFPWLIAVLSGAAAGTAPLVLVGLIVGALGSILLGSAHWLVYRPAQWTSQRSPFGTPDGLVTTGPYRYLRHPQLVGVYAVILAWALALPHWTLFAYLVATMVTSMTVAVRAEEKQVEQAFPVRYRDYRSRTRRFVPGVV
ncbi:isoprenylcysteine carboxylmethyltransferase family protein [Nonomuraea sp. B5E05]|uniref:methyltransferase family protein n=1 Tax=Nonomuraea sp. B5E05 TaxID=3153569 RepID=UPI003260B6D2